MFYPCVYLFAIWDAYRDAGGRKPYAFLPFVFSAYFGTIGVVYSSLLLGPVWLPIIFLILGAFLGFFVKKLCLHSMESRSEKEEKHVIR